MRVKRNKESSVVKSAAILLVLMAVLVAVVYYMNPLDSRQKLADFFELKQEAKQPEPEPSAKAEEGAANGQEGDKAAQPQPSASASETPAESAEPDAVAAAGSKTLSRSVAPTAWAMADDAYASPDLTAIGAGKLFSFREWLQGEGAAISPDNRQQLASLLYEAAMKAGLEIGERNVHAELPASMNPGFDVALPEEDSDLKIYNPYKFDVAWSLNLTNGKPGIEIGGNPDAEWKAPEVAVKRETFAPSQVVLIDFSKSGANEAGRPGALIKVFVNEKLEHKDFYEPVAASKLRNPTPEEMESMKHESGISAK